MVIFLFVILQEIGYTHMRIVEGVNSLLQLSGLVARMCSKVTSQDSWAKDEQVVHAEKNKDGKRRIVKDFVQSTTLKYCMWFAVPGFQHVSVWIWSQSRQALIYLCINNHVEQSVFFSYN